MKVVDINDFNFKSVVAHDKYLSADIIEELDLLNILDRIIDVYVDEACSEYECIDDLYRTIAEEVTNNFSVEEIWGLCTILPREALTEYSKYSFGWRIDDVIIGVVEHIIYSLITYKPVNEFLSAINNFLMDV